MSNSIQSSLTREQVIAAIKALAAADRDITHTSIRNQLLSNGFRPTNEDLQMSSSRTFMWLKHLSFLLQRLQQTQAIEVVSSNGRKGTKYKLVEQSTAPTSEPRQITLPEYSSTEQLAIIAADLAAIRALLQQLVAIVAAEPDPTPEPVNGNGKHPAIV